MEDTAKVPTSSWWRGRELLWRVVLPGMLGTPPEKTCLESVSPVPDDSVHILCPQVYHFLLKLAREQCCLQLRALTQSGGDRLTLWKPVGGSGESENKMSERPL